MITALLTLSAVANGASALLFRRKNEKAARLLFVAAWLISALTFAVNWVQSGHAPFANMVQVLAFLPLALLPTYVFFYFFERDMAWMSAAFPALACVPIIGTLFMDRTADWSLNPALDSPFFVPHVMSYCFSYALCGVAFLMGIAFFFLGEKRDRCLEAIHALIRLAVPFMTLGLCLGALWAEQAWGIYWSWDAKETFSLVTWLIYLGFLHLRKQKHNKTLANILQMLGFIALLGTFFGVNLLTSVHAYAIA